jgi:hypothetical protein
MPYTVGPGIAAAMQARGDTPQSDERYITDWLSLAAGEQGLYVYVKQADRVYFLASSSGGSPWMPNRIAMPSPNHGGARALTIGCVLHATRGGAATPDAEFRGTLAWFTSTKSQVSAHVVIAADGTIAECVDPTLIAWHARSYNATHLGLEFVQARAGDSITDAQYRSAGWWLAQMSRRFNFPLDDARLPEHREIPPGRAEGKTDIGPPFDRQKLIAAARAFTARTAANEGG